MLFACHSRHFYFVSDDGSIEKKDEETYWPHWCEYVAWTICSLVTLIAAFFTLLYGLTFQRTKQEEWLVSLFTSVFQDVFISQPVKVIYKSLCTPVFQDVFISQPVKVIYKSLCTPR